MKIRYLLNVNVDGWLYVKWDEVFGNIRGKKYYVCERNIFKNKLNEEIL